MAARVALRFGPPAPAPAPAAGAAAVATGGSGGIIKDPACYADGADVVLRVVGEELLRSTRQCTGRPRHLCAALLACAGAAGGE